MPIASMRDQSIGPMVDDSLFVLDMPSGSLAFIRSTPPGIGYAMTLSPDGSFVASTAADRTTGRFSLQIARSNGTDARTLTLGQVHESPSFSPDGRQIAWFEMGTNDIRLRIRDLESNVDVIVADRISTLHSPEPSWSPDAKRIVFGRRLAADSLTIWSVGADGSELQRLTPPGEQDVDPEWAPGGSSILCASRQSPNGQRLIVMNGDGTGRRIVSGTDEIVLHNPAWSPDGTRIVYNTSYPSLLKVADVASGVVTILATEIYGAAYWDMSR